MLKSRNSFFQETSTQANSYLPNQYPMYNQPPVNQPAPYQAVKSQQSFYAGPLPNQNYPTQNYPTQQGYDDYENRLAKIERQINRIDARITKLENSAKLITDDVSSSMYMV